MPGITQAQAAVGQISYSNLTKLEPVRFRAESVKRVELAHLGTLANLAGMRES